MAKFLKTQYHSYINWNHIKNIYVNSDSIYAKVDQYEFPQLIQDGFSSLEEAQTYLDDLIAKNEGAEPFSNIIGRAIYKDKE